ncbi:hypothetical protein D3C71_2236920 [compost metagenome]
MFSWSLVQLLHKVPVALGSQIRICLAGLHGLFLEAVQDEDGVGQFCDVDDAEGA